jgi:hypothetical protein
VRLLPVVAVLAVALLVLAVVLSRPDPLSCARQYEALRDRLDEYAVTFDARLLRDLPPCR